MKKLKIGIVSLGCAKNLVDSEIMLASFVNANYDITNNPKEADIILVNTCAFIKDSKKEAIDTILEMAKYKKKLIVTGCLAERYYKELKKEIPEIDLIIPLSKYKHFNEYVSNYLKDNKTYNFEPLNRVISTSNNVAYLRIAEGCNNFCSFCAIPYIRGRYISRPLKEIVKEANILAKDGIKELNIIAQDVSSYGIDLHNKTTLVTLLKELEKIKDIKHIRLLYLYPSEITNEFISFMKNSKKVYPYFDIPLQHVSDKLLKSMHRKGNQNNTLTILNKIRKEIPNAIFRTTFIVGYPGETNSDFKKLLSFVKDFKFDHLGVFTYSKEEGTKAYALPDQVNEKTKSLRKDILMKEQEKISYKLNQTHINKVVEGLCIGFNKDNNTYSFLTKFNGPDDIDGRVFGYSKKPLNLGKYYKLKIKDAFVYDLFVEIN